MHLFVDNLYEDITMKMVLESLSMHPGTFYRYFEDKDDLYYLLIRNVTQKRAAYFNNSNEDILRRMRVDGYLRPDIDDDLISFMFESMQFNLVMFFREFDIKDSKLQHKISKYFADIF